MRRCKKRQRIENNLSAVFILPQPSGIYYEKRTYRPLDMGRNRKRHDLKEKIASAFEVPGDVALAAAVVTITGTWGVLIENYRRILEYTDSVVLIQTKTRRLKICGENLKIEYYTNDEMKVKGVVHSLEYLRQV